jgi:NIMA (never in mitosis gene a)-related kinase
MEQLLQGYMDIHRGKVVHRDLKPANIFLQGRQLKIADFGFSVQAEQVRDPCSYNVGSPLYMAPEVLLRNHYSFKSDIWALGIIYYELLFGCRPWTAKDEK